MNFIVRGCSSVCVCVFLLLHRVMSIEIHYNHLMYSTAPLYILSLNALIKDLLILLVFFIGTFSDDFQMHSVFCG